MVSTANMTELQLLIQADVGDPHHILGMHELEIDNKPVLVVRAFIPQAVKITVLDPNDPSLCAEMEKVHFDGFFEVILKDRTVWFRHQLQIEFDNGSVYTTYDPYSFLPVISALDRHLFGQGTHYEIYKKLGAHIMTIDGVEGTLFAVWAPNAKRVSVIGDFNSWDGRRHQMRILEKSGIWELFVPGVKKLDRYKFEVKTRQDQLLQKTDPYANFCELRPSTSALVFDLEQYEWNDTDWQSQEDTTLNKPMNIYEVHLGSWKRVESDNNRFMSYLECADELIPYVKEMGYTHIELMGISEYPFDGSWGYQVTGYYAPTSRYGSPDEFMYFIDQCHQNEIGVIMDWVPAHFIKDPHGLVKFDGTALYEHQDPRQGEHPEWGTLIYNYGRSEVKNFLIGNAIYWTDVFHIDGFRVDAVASMLYLDYGKKNGEWISNQYGGNENYEAVEFMRHLNSVLTARNPRTLIIAEESTSWANVSKPAEQNGLGFNLKWNMGWMNDFLLYMSKEPVHRKYHHNNLTFGIFYAYSENFVLVLSHDEVVHGKKSLIDKMPGDLWQKFANLRAAYAFMYGHPGKKLLFMGGEFGQFIEWSENKSLEWFLLKFEQHEQLHTFVKDLNHFYLKDEPSWVNDFNPCGFEWINCTDWQKSIVSFVRIGNTPQDITIFVCNFTPAVNTDFRIGVPFAGTYQEVINSDDQKYGGSGVTNTNDMIAEEMVWDDRKYSIPLKLSPLGVSIIKLKK